MNYSVRIIQYCKFMVYKSENGECVHFISKDPSYNSTQENEFQQLCLHLE